MPDDNPEEDDWLGGYRLANPPHPGLFLQTEIIRGRGLNIGEAAVALRVLRPTLSAVLNGRAGLSPEMALRFEKAFSLSMDTLMRMQCAYDNDAGQMRARADEVDVLPFVPKPKPGQARPAWCEPPRPGTVVPVDRGDPPLRIGSQPERYR